MKTFTPSQTEVAEILHWEETFPSLTDDQKSLCVVLHRHSGPMHEDELASSLDCTVEELRQAKRGIFGILVDTSRRDNWIK